MLDARASRSKRSRRDAWRIAEHLPLVRDKLAGPATLGFRRPVWDRRRTGGRRPGADARGHNRLTFLRFARNFGDWFPAADCAMVRRQGLPSRHCQGGGAHGHRARTRRRRRRLGAVSPAEPVVVDADRLELELHRPHASSITFWITGVVFAAVVLFMAYCVFRFRHREGARAHYEPENKRLESWLTVVTAVGVAAMLTPGLFVWANFVTVPDEATDVEVVAQQWQWSYRLPGEDGRLGRSDARLIGPDNPLGVDPDDPNGRRRRDRRGRRPAPADRPAGQDAAALDRRAARLLRAGVPRQDGHGAGHDHLLLVHPHAHRRVRGALRRALRHRARLHARLRA